jgi:hypothetical protein
MKRTTVCYFYGAACLLLALLLAACPPADGSPDTDAGAETVPSVPPRLLGTSVSYDPATFAPSAAFTFDRAVADAVPGAGWVAVTDGKVVSLSPLPETVLVPGEAVDVTLSVANALDGTKTASAEAAVMPVSRKFARGDGGLYTVAWYGETGDGKTGAAALRDGDGATDGYLVEEARLRELFYAVYAPNAPEKGDRETSAAVLALFRVTVGETRDGDGVEIAGTELPPPRTDNLSPTVIGIGTGVTGAELPFFYIRNGMLGMPPEEGVEEPDYGHILIRVGRGAGLAVEPAENHRGYLANSTVEVTSGGSFRGGAEHGFLLGKGTRIVARLGSRVAAGTDWIIGSAKDGAAVCWDAGDQNGGYIEISDGEPRPRLAFDANITVRGPLTVRCDVWFVNSATLTVDIEGGGTLEAGDGGERFYGTFFRSGGQNPSRPAAKIVVRPDSAVSRSFLAEDGEGFLEAGPGGTTVLNGGKGAEGPASTAAEYGRGGIIGFLNWNVL